jgi:hypothetical protein
MSGEGKVVTVRMTAGMHSELKAYCENTSRSMNGVITSLIQGKLLSVDPAEKVPHVSANSTVDPANISPAEPKTVSGFQQESKGEL